jgi:hypothetical protein
VEADPARALPRQRGALAADEDRLGYWHVADSQAGYTALSLAALDRLDLERIYRRYGFPNDMLVHLNVVSASVRDVPSRPIYGVGERSGIKIRSVAPRIAWLLFKGFWWRMKEKYVIRDFHPLVFFYVLGTLMTVLGLLLGHRRRRLALFFGNEITTRRSCSSRCSSSRARSSPCSGCGSTRSRTRSLRLTGCPLHAVPRARPALVAKRLANANTWPTSSTE